MKKRILILACALALLVGCLVVSSTAATQSKYCEYCKKTVTWEPIKFGTHTLPEGEQTLHKHYYFDKDYNHTTAQQINLKGNDMTLCIDLNGKSWYSWGRAFYANFSASDAGDKCTINIQDSVGGGAVTSRAEAWLKADGTVTGTNNTGGANIWIEKNCTVNIYGGTFKLDAIVSEQGLRVDNGGIASVCAGGALNLYGGTLQGGNIKKTGGAVYLYNGGKLNICGGAIKAGTSADGTGGAVGLQKVNGTPTHGVTLSGDASVDNIYFPALRAGALTVNGSFTGRANLTYPSGTTLAVGTAVGTLASGGDISGGDLFCTNGTGYSVVADGTSLKLAEVSLEDVRHECPHCKQTVKWEPFTTTAPSEAGSYHFYLTRDYDTSAAKQYGLKAGVQVCLDLYGHFYRTTGRSFNVGASGAVLSILDSQGSGAAGAIGGDNNPGGGSVNVSTGATLNVYSGTLDFTHNASASKWGGTGRGGVIQNSGTVNIYGGKILGGEVVDCTYEFTGIEGAGGAIYNNGVLNIQGGEITEGIAPESGAGPCIYNVGGKTITLGGDAKVEDIYFASNDASKFTVAGSFTGTARLSYAPSVVLSQGLVVGACDSADWQGTIACNSEAYPTALPVEGELVLSAYPVGTVAATGGEGYTSLQAAIDAAAEGAVVELMSSVKGDITVGKSIILQLNGCSVDGTVTVAEGKTLSGMDSATADFSVKDGKYGKLTKVVGAVSGGTEGSDSYIVITEDSGVSFHCVRLQIYAMTLRTDDAHQPGLFYKSYFKADEKAAPMIATYGVALSLIGEPNGKNLEEDCRYTEFEGFESGALGNLGNSSSTLLTGILKEKYSEKVNKQNAQLPIYGRAYAKTTDGQYLFGATVCRSYAQQLQAIDQMIPSLSELQATAVVNTCTKFEAALDGLELPGIDKAIQDREEGTLKVLVLGNSHGLDATNLLAEVFYQERVAGNHDKDVLIAALYYSGCRVDQHHDFLSGNQKVYSYHKNYATTAGEKWVVEDATCLDALQDEQWDVILMQQMNTNAAQDRYYNADDWKYVAEYLLNNQDSTPILGFHLTWANPDDYELYLNDDAPYKIGTGNHAGWRNNHEKLFPGADGKYDQTVMYNKIMELTQKYLVDSTDWLGTDYFNEAYIMNSATAVHYAQNVLGRSHDNIYRDYTHMNDYGRLICAYQWYAQLLGLEEISEVNTDVIPASLKHRNSKYPSATDPKGDYIVDAQMKADLIESVNWTLKNPFHLPE